MEVNEKEVSRKFKFKWLINLVNKDKLIGKFF